MRICFAQFADYPAIVPCKRSKTLLGRELTQEENSVRGTLVTGFTAMDIMFLDVFEGDVRIYALSYSVANNMLTPCFAGGVNSYTCASRCLYIHWAD